MKHTCLIITSLIVGFTVNAQPLKFKSYKKEIDEPGKPSVTKKVNALITFNADEKTLDFYDVHPTHLKIIKTLSKHIEDEGEDTETYFMNFLVRDDKGKEEKVELAILAHTMKGMDGMLLIHTGKESQITYKLLLQPPQ